MTVSSVTSNYASTLGTQTTAATEATDALGRDAFLTMLVAQMKNQDPLNPMDGTDFTAQLAQFSSLEQLFTVNDNLESMAASLGTGSEKNLLDYIGKEVSFDAADLSVQDGVVMAGGGFTLAEDATQVVINVYDGKGAKVAQINTGQKEAGTYGVNWNGLDQNGDQVADGAYSFEVLAYDASQKEVSVDTAFTGTISGVTYQFDKPYLLVGKQLVDPETVTQVNLIDS